MAEEYKVTLKAVLDTTDIKQQLAGLQGQNTSSFGNAVSSLEKATKDAAKAQDEAATAAKSAALGFKDAKGIIKAVAGGFAAKVIGNTIGGTAGATVAGVGQGAAAGAAFGPMGMAVGAALGGFDAITTSINKSRQELEDALKKVSDALVSSADKLKSPENWVRRREFVKNVAARDENSLQNLIDVLNADLKAAEEKVAPETEIAARRKFAEEYAANSAAGKGDKYKGDYYIEYTNKFLADQEKAIEDVESVEEKLKIATEALAKLRKEREEKEKKAAEDEAKANEDARQQRLEVIKLQNDAEKNLKAKIEADKAKIEADKKKQLSELDKQLQNNLKDVPNLMQNIGDMTSIQKYGFGMGEVEDSAISLAQMQLDMQTQIRNSVEQIKNNITGNSTQVAVAG